MVKGRYNTEGFPLKEACKWLFWSAVIAPIPVWTQLFLLPIFFEVPTLSQFADKGEFAIYSASIFAPALYLLSKDLKASVIKGRGVFVPACSFCLFIAILLYTAVTASALGKIAINLVFIRTVSLILFLVSIGIRSYPDITSLRKDGEKKLEEQFQNSGE